MMNGKNRGQMSPRLNTLEGNPVQLGRDVRRQSSGQGDLLQGMIAFDKDEDIGSSLRLTLSSQISQISFSQSTQSTQSLNLIIFRRSRNKKTIVLLCVLCVLCEIFIFWRFT